MSTVIAPTPNETPTPELNWNQLREKSDEDFTSTVLGEPKTPAPSAKEEPPAQPPVEEPKAPETPETPAEETLEQKLAKIDEEATPKEETPALDGEHKAVLELFPTRQTAEQAAFLLSSYANFTGNFVNGNFDGTLQMLKDYAPEAYAAFEDHLYSKHIEGWIDRWIRQQKGVEDPQIRQMQQRLDLMERAASERSQREAQQQKRMEQAQANQKFNAYLDGLFNKIQFPADDRQWVTAAIKTQLAMDPKASQQLREGNLSGVMKVFKDVATKYVNRDKKSADIKQAQLAQQAERKPPVSQVPSVLESGLPDDIDQVPAGKRDQWVTEKLTNLFKGRKK